MAEYVFTPVPPVPSEAKFAVCKYGWGSCFTYRVFNKPSRLLLARFGSIVDGGDFGANRPPRVINQTVQAKRLASLKPQ